MSAGIEIGSAYSASIFCMLRDFALFDLLSKRRTVARAIATSTADFLGAFGHSDEGCSRDGMS